MQQLDKIRSAAIGALHVLRKPLYLLLTFIIAFVFALLIFTVINGKFYGSLLLSSLPIIDKFNVVGNIARDMFSNIFKNFNGILLLIVSVLQGISISIMVYVTKHNRHEQRITPPRAGINGVAAVAAAIGLGCVPCGTSLILPIIMLFFSGSAVALAADIASAAVLGIAILLSLYTIYRSGKLAYMYFMFEKSKGDDK